MDTAGAAAEFGAVDDEVVMVCYGEGRVYGEKRDIVRS